MKRFFLKCSSVCVKLLLGVFSVGQKSFFNEDATGMAVHVGKQGRPNVQGSRGNLAQIHVWT